MVRSLDSYGIQTLAAVCILIVGGPTTPASGQCELAKLLASDGAQSDQFGFSVSISGDVAIVGSPYDDDLGSVSGAAYVYRYDGSAWLEEAKLLALDGAGGDYFGISVGISGDVAIVSARSDDDNGDASGSAYIFRYDGVDWVQEGKLLASDGAASDSFGWAVAVNGDVALVGAPADDDFGESSGSAYIFRYTGTSWIQVDKLLATGGMAGDFFGVSVALVLNAAVVGARASDEFGNASGSVYVFREDVGDWIQEAKLLASDGAEMDLFGQSVAMSGSAIIVGADRNGDNGIESGSAYIFRYDGASWTEEAKLLASDGEAYDHFGWSVAIDGDAALVGAYYGDVLGVTTGSVYVYRHQGGGWIEEGELGASDGASGDQFGYAVSLDGDLAVAGAPLDDDWASSSGAAYVFGGFTNDCNANGVFDCADLINGTSSDYDRNAAPDECDDFVYNLTQDVIHATLADALAGAATNDELLSSPARFIAEPTLDLSGKAVSLTSFAEIVLPVGGQCLLSDNSALHTAPTGWMLLDGELSVGLTDDVDLSADSLSIGLTGRLVALPGAGIDFTSPLGIFNQGDITLHGAVLGVTGLLSNTIYGEMTVYGDLVAFFQNEGDFLCIADTRVIGNFDNFGTTTIQNGTLTIIGALTNSGTIIGDVAGGAALKGRAALPGGLTVLGDYGADAGGSLMMPSVDQVVRIEGHYDVAINDNANYDMSLAELRMIGLEGAAQNLEIMSLDLGENPDGYNRNIPGHFPLGKLRIGPGATTVNMVDHHDNDGLGQGSCEAIYAAMLVIDAGATLNTGGCKVYYQTLQLDGVVDEPLNLINVPAPLPCPADSGGDGQVNVLDLLALLGTWGPCPAPCPEDNDESGTVDVVDLLALLGAWGPCP